MYAVRNATSLLRSIAFLKEEHAMSFLYLCELGSKECHKATTRDGVPLVDSLWIAFKHDLVIYTNVI